MFKIEHRTKLIDVNHKIIFLKIFWAEMVPVVN